MVHRGNAIYTALGCLFLVLVILIVYFGSFFEFSSRIAIWIVAAFFLVVAIIYFRLSDDGRPT